MGDKLYSMHIIFANGSKPWSRFNMTRAEYGFEVNRWMKKYDLRHLHESYGVHYFLAKQKDLGRV